jgi:hypothetical protein
MGAADVVLDDRLRFRRGGGHEVLGIADEWHVHRADQ